MGIMIPIMEYHMQKTTSNGNWAYRVVYRDKVSKIRGPVLGAQVIVLFI